MLHLFLRKVQKQILWTTDLSPSLLVTVNNIVRAINNKLQVGAVILDFSKAFDKVAHKLLLYKLDYYGLEEFIKFNWLTSFLLIRSQEVVVKGINSSSCNVTSIGVGSNSWLGG